VDSWRQALSNKDFAFPKLAPLPMRDEAESPAAGPFRARTTIVNSAHRDIRILSLNGGYEPARWRSFHNLSTTGPPPVMSPLSAFRPFHSAFVRSQHHSTVLFLENSATVIPHERTLGRHMVSLIADSHPPSNRSKARLLQIESLSLPSPARCGRGRRALYVLTTAGRTLSLFPFSFTEDFWLR